jgi:hypothetical protein
METIRKQIQALITSSPSTLRDISQELRISEKEALDHLEHINKSKSAGKMTIDPAVCSLCGFVFKQRQRLGKPGRCPECKGGSISPPRYSLT